MRLYHWFENLHSDGNRIITSVFVIQVRKEAPHVVGRHATAILYVVAAYLVMPMPVILIPAIIGGTIVILGGGYWLMHLH